MRDKRVRAKFDAACMTALLAIIISFAAGASASSTAQHSAESNDAKLTSFLQKRFRLPQRSDVKMGPRESSEIPGLWKQTVQLENAFGQRARLTVYGGASPDHVLAGQFLDLNSDPWGRVDLSHIHLKDRPTLGAANAPITMIEFADFECPLCARAFGQVESLVLNKYKGKVKLIYKYFPLRQHLWAMHAAVAAECARRQNPKAFWVFARRFYTHQSKINPLNLDQQIYGMAKTLKLDQSALSACMEGESAQNRVQQDMSDGESLRVRATPEFFVNGIPLIGLQGNGEFRFVINSLLKEETARK